MQLQLEVLAGKFENVAAVAETMDEICGQIDHSQRMVQQVIDNKNPLLLRQLRTSTEHVIVRVNGRFRS